MSQPPPSRQVLTFAQIDAEWLTQHSALSVSALDNAYFAENLESCRAGSDAMKLMMMLLRVLQARPINCGRSKPLSAAADPRLFAVVHP